MTPEISENGIDDGELVFTRYGSMTKDLLVNYSVSGTAPAGNGFRAARRLGDHSRRPEHA